MKLPSELIHHTEWTLTGPMGPNLPEKLQKFPVIGVDGGAQHAQEMKIWVGDGDSHDKEVIGPEVFRFSPEKSISDLGLALRLFPQGPRYRLHLWGFLGGRQDHELFNLGEVSRFLESHPESQVLFYGPGGLHFHFVGEGNWRFHHVGSFSLGCLKNVKIRLEGDCKYPLKQETHLFPLSSLGLSNEAQGEIDLYCQGPVFVYYPGGKP